MRIHIILIALAAIACTSCADFETGIDKRLNLKSINNQIGETVPDLMVGAQCPGTQQVSVEFVEEGKGKRVLSSFPNIKVRSKDFALSIERYFTEALEEANVTVVPTGGKLIKVEIEDASVSTGWGPVFATTKLAVSFPDWNYSAIYTGDATSGNIEKGIVWSIHKAIIACLNDPKVQNHIRCID
ncbi:MAG: hypothetical protein JXA96_02850 [Sedimentisphaerales bacterium]|nr:hypothetical protein [Sedimentisphaerales bacterium]